jgi:dynein heavy chain
LQVFGLHPNADITYQAKTTTDVLETIVNIQPKDSGGGGGETRETVVFRQASEMLDKLPPNYVPHEVRKVEIAFNNITYYPGSGGFLLR